MTLARTPQKLENQKSVSFVSRRSEANTCFMNALMTSAEVATILHVSEPTLSRWRYARTGPPYIDLNGIPRYREADVTAWIKEKSA